MGAGCISDMHWEVFLGHFGGRLHQFHAQGAARGRYMAAFHSVAPRVNCTGKCFWAILGAGTLHAWGRLDMMFCVATRLSIFGFRKNCFFFSDVVLRKPDFENLFLVFGFGKFCIMNFKKNDFLKMESETEIHFFQNQKPKINFQNSKSKYENFQTQQPKINFQNPIFSKRNPKETF